MFELGYILSGQYKRDMHALFHKLDQIEYRQNKLFRLINRRGSAMATQLETINEIIAEQANDFNSLVEVLESVNATVDNINADVDKLTQLAQNNPDLQEVINSLTQNTSKLGEAKTALDQTKGRLETLDAKTENETVPVPPDENPTEETEPGETEEETEPQP